jgi:plastocyanin
MMEGSPPRTDPMVGEVRFRVPLPVLIPIAAVVAIALITIGFSRVLLAVPKEIATVVALVTAANVLGAFAVIALRPRLSQATLVELALVVLYPVIIGVAIAQLGVGEETEAATEAETEAPAGQGAPAEGTVVAEGVQFNTDTIELRAGEQASIPFQNNDSVEHNIAIYKTSADAEAQEQAIFDGDTITASETTYEFRAPRKGEYIFQCDVHPAMNGRVIVE